MLLLRIADVEPVPLHSKGAGANILRGVAGAGSQSSCRSLTAHNIVYLQVSSRCTTNSRSSCYLQLVSSPAVLYRSDRRPKITSCSGTIYLTGQLYGSIEGLQNHAYITMHRVTVRTPRLARHEFERIWNCIDLDSLISRQSGIRHVRQQER